MKKRFFSGRFVHHPKSGFYRKTVFLKTVFLKWKNGFFPVGFWFDRTKKTVFKNGFSKLKKPVFLN